MKKSYRALIMVLMLMFTVSLSSVNTNAETTYVAYDLNLQAHTVTAGQITEVAAATLDLIMPILSK